jgi:hypothetical protein
MDAVGRPGRPCAFQRFGRCKTCRWMTFPKKSDETEDIRTIQNI